MKIKKPTNKKNEFIIRTTFAYEIFRYDFWQVQYNILSGAYCECAGNSYGEQLRNDVAAVQKSELKYKFDKSVTYCQQELEINKMIII